MPRHRQACIFRDEAVHRAAPAAVHGSIVAEDESVRGRAVRSADRAFGAPPRRPPSLRPPSPAPVSSAASRRRLRGRRRQPAPQSDVDCHLRAADFRRRHSGLSRPVAARCLGLLEGPVCLAEPDLLADRQARTRRRGAGTALHCSSTARSAPPPQDGSASELDEAHLARRRCRAAVIARRRSWIRPSIMGEIIRSRGLVTAVGTADASGNVQTVLLRQRLRARLCRRQDPLSASPGSGLGVHRFTTHRPVR